MPQYISKTIIEEKVIQSKRSIKKSSTTKIYLKEEKIKKKKVHKNCGPYLQIIKLFFFFSHFLYNLFNRTDSHVIKTHLN